MHAAVLCLAVAGAGVAVVNMRSGESPSPVHVEFASGPGAAGGAPQAYGPEPLAEAVAGAVSLADLAKAARAKAATTSTTRPRTTSTTAKRVTTTTSRPATTTTTVVRVAAPAPTTSTTLTPLTPLTTLLQKVVPPAAAVSSAITRSDSGVASWFKAPDATCAHRTLPMGTSIKVTRTANGASATCRVNDRGPTLETGRLIDLSLDTFEKLADRGTGLIDVTIEW